MAAAETNSRAAVSSDKGIKNPIIVIDNYDSFTYNLCQVSAFSS
jgi:anthranilate synthase component 2